MLDKAKIKVVAFDLDGTLSQHKQPLPIPNKEALTALNGKYKLLMVSAGQIMRVFNQLDRFPIDIVANYGMQYGRYNSETKSLDIVRNVVIPCDKDKTDAFVTEFRKKHGFTEYTGKNTEFHPSGCITIPLLGTEAKLEDKLAFDPDRSKRRAIYKEVVDSFPDYNVFIAGTSSFDMNPKPYNKYYALDSWCTENGYAHDEVVFVGDDYGVGGNDEPVYKSDFNFIKVDSYLNFPEKVKVLIEK